MTPKCFMTLSSQDAATHQIWDSYLKEYRICTRLDVDSQKLGQVKVTMTQGWNMTLHHPKMHQQSKFGIPSSNNMRYATDKTILKPKSRSQWPEFSETPNQAYFYANFWFCTRTFPAGDSNLRQFFFLLVRRLKLLKNTWRQQRESKFDFRHKRSEDRR